MTERTYRLVLGGLLMVALYFDVRYMAFAVIAIMVVEGATNWNILLISGRTEAACSTALRAERIWRLTIGLGLFLSFSVFPEKFWFLPWFLAFAIFGAGVTDICPWLSALRRVGFK